MLDSLYEKWVSKSGLFSGEKKYIKGMSTSRQASHEAAAYHTSFVLSLVKGKIKSQEMDKLAVLHGRFNFIKCMNTPY